ncbi:thioredoxin [Pelagibacteraceae bacterium]|nr:thioredoxin [Pelagibacteraceae bacterium]
MSTFVTNDENFDEDISSQKVPVIVDFGAEWCGPCKQLDPILEQIAHENTDKLKVFKINIDENPLTPQKFGVRGIPTIMLFNDGKLIDTKVGSLPKSSLDAWIKSNL